MPSLRDLLFPAREPPEEWEYLNRVRWVAGQLAAFGPEPRVLDVGGGTGDNLLRRFGVRNVQTLDEKAHADVSADARNLPFDDGSYDVVTCLDTLEHIPAVDREKVVSELLRIAAQGVIIVAPQNSPENAEAERLVLKYVDLPFLREHVQFGLVNFHAIEAQLSGRGLPFHRAELDNLQTWVVAMLSGHCSVARAYEEAFTLENRFVPRRIGLTVDVRKK